MTTTRNTVRTLAATLAATAIAGLALAQPLAPRQGRGQNLGQGQGQGQCQSQCQAGCQAACLGQGLGQGQGRGQGLLRGPAVTDTNVPGAQNTFAGRPMAGQGDRPEDRPISMRAFVRTVQRLDAPGVAPELNLNEGQRAVIEVMQREYDDALALWRNENKEQLRELRNDRRPGDKPRGRRGAAAPARGDQQARAGQPMDRRFRDDQQAERLGARAPRDRQGRAQPDENTKAQVRAIMETRPSAERQQSQVWDILTPEQQSFVEMQFERRRADDLAKQEMKRQRQEQRADAQSQGIDRDKMRQGRRGKGRRGQGTRGQGPALLDGESTEQFRQRMMQRLEQLPADRQEEALERLNRAIDRMEQQSGNPNNL